MRKFIGSILILLIFMGVSLHAAEKGDLLIQVDLDEGPHVGCSILQVKKDGTLSEFVSGTSVTQVTQEPDCDFDDTGMATGLKGLIYFSEDTSDHILTAYPNGALKTFITDEVVEMVLPGAVNWDNGMAINPVTGDLVAADGGNNALVEFPTDVPTPITDPALINILATQADFEALVGVGEVGLEGGIAIDQQQNIYISNDFGNDEDDVIFKLTPQGDLSILCSRTQLENIPGVGPDIDLDVGMAVNGSLYVGDDGNCDCIIKINPNNCDNAEVLFAEDQIVALTGNEFADLEGGLCIDSEMNLFLGDDGFINSDPIDRPSILSIPADNTALASLFVSSTELRTFYDQIAPFDVVHLEGSCTVRLIEADTVPTLSEWGMIAMAAVLGLAGLIVARRRMVNV